MKPLSNLELSSFCEQMALILKSGISSTEGLSVMLEESQSPQEQELLGRIMASMNETFTLYSALEETGVFPQYMIRMTQIGEETGTLDEVMDSLAGHYDREETIAASIKSAVTYPLIMAGMMLIVIFVLLVKVMPIFNRVFVQLGTEMTGLSRVLMNIGTILGRYGTVFIVLIILIAAILLYGTRTESGKAMFRSLSYRFGTTRSLNEKICASRFASGMALTLRSGLDPARGLDLVSGLNDDPVFAQKISTCREKLNESGELSDAIAESRIFEGVYTRMASIGEKTGALEKVMSRIAIEYQNDIDVKINNTLAALEPTLVIVLSLFVGMILLSVMLPLMGIMASI